MLIDVLPTIVHCGVRAVTTVNLPCPVATDAFVRLPKERGTRCSLCGCVKPKMQILS